MVLMLITGDTDCWERGGWVWFCSNRQHHFQRLERRTLWNIPTSGDRFIIVVGWKNDQRMYILPIRGVVSSEIVTLRRISALGHLTPSWTGLTFWKTIHSSSNDLIDIDLNLIDIDIDLIFSTAAFVWNRAKGSEEDGQSGPMIDHDGGSDSE